MGNYLTRKKNVYINVKNEVKKGNVNYDINDVVERGNLFENRVHFNTDTINRAVEKDNLEKEKWVIETTFDEWEAKKIKEWIREPKNLFGKRNN